MIYRLLGGAGVFALLAFAIWIYGGARYHAGQLSERMIWQAKTAAATLDDTKHANTVETAQTVVSQEQSDDLKARLADALARAAARPRRLCDTPHGNSDVTHLPEPAYSTTGVDDTDQISKLDDAACAEGVTKAQGWVDWYKAVSAIQR